jgi:diacylglycerol kinase (ATP)
MNRKLLFLLNPISGGKKTSRLPDRIKKFFDSSKIPYFIKETPADNNYSSLKKFIDQENISDVIICGGDGTINAVVNHLRDELLRFGIIPCGSGNGLALACKIPLNSEKAFKIVLKGNDILADGLMVNERLSCMVFGIGLDGKVSRDFNQSTSRGFFLYAWLTLKNIIRLKHSQYRLRIHEKDYDIDAHMICLATGNQFGNRFTIAPKASINDGLMDVVIVKNMSVPAFIFRVVRHLFFGKPSTSFQEYKPVIYFQTKSIKILNKQKTPVHFDGDTCMVQENWEARVLQRAYRLIVP